MEGPFITPPVYAPQANLPVASDSGSSRSGSAAGTLSASPVSVSDAPLAPTGRSRAHKNQSAAGGVPVSNRPPGVKRAKTKDDLLAEQLAATEEIGRKRSARVEALKRASEESEMLARQQLAATAARKKAAIEKAKAERQEKERIAKEHEEAEAARQAAERKKKLDDLRARQAAKSAADDERKRAESESAAAEQKKKDRDAEEKRAKKEATLLAREASRTRQRIALSDSLAAESRAVADKKSELESAEAELRLREKRVKELERAKSQSVQDAEAKLAALQQSIAMAAKNKEQMAVEAEKAKRAAEEEAAAQRVKQRQKDERLRIEMEQKVKRKLEWAARRAQQLDATKAASAASPADDGKDAGASAPVPPASHTGPTTARARAKAASLASAPTASSLAATATSPRRPRPSASTARVRQLRRTTVPTRRSVAPSATTWTPAMAREMAATWSFLFGTYGSFLPAERVAPCVAALVTSRAHPRDAIDFTHNELHEMNISNWRIRKDILDTTRAYLRRLQTDFVQSGTKVLYDEHGAIVQSAAVQTIIEDQLARGEAANNNASTHQAGHASTIQFASNTLPLSFDPLSSTYSGPLFDASGLPVDLADIAAAYLKSQMQHAKQVAADKIAKANAEQEAKANAPTAEEAHPNDGVATAAVAVAPTSQASGVADDEVTLLTIGGGISQLTITSPKHQRVEPQAMPPTTTVSSAAPTKPAAGTYHPTPPTQPKTYSVPVGRASVVALASGASSVGSSPVASPVGSPKPAATGSKLTYAQMMAQRHAKKDDIANRPQQPATHTMESATSASATGVPPSAASDEVIMLPLAHTPAHAHAGAAAASAALSSSPSTARAATRPSGIPTYQPPTGATAAAHTGHTQPHVTQAAHPHTALVDSPATLASAINVRATTPTQPGKVYKLFGKKAANTNPTPIATHTSS